MLALAAATIGHPTLTQNSYIQTAQAHLPSEIQNHPLSEKLCVAMQMGREAGAGILSVKQSKDLQVTMKEDKTPVTRADEASNQIICETISRFYPKDGILSEETIKGEKTLNDAIARSVNADFTWVIDPLDGTKSFIKSIDSHSLNLDPRYKGKHYGVHIGLLENGQPVLGVNYYPEIDTLYFALDGFAYKKVGNTPAERIMSKAPLIGISPVLNPTAKERDIVGKIYEKLMGTEEAAHFKENGLFLDSFGFKMMSIAEGNGCNLYITPPAKAEGAGYWDVCSGILFVLAAGGSVTDVEGNPINFRDMSQNGLVAKGAIISNGLDHQAIVDAAKGVF